jgi:hypothetical protein
LSCLGWANTARLIMIIAAASSRGFAQVIIVHFQVHLPAMLK